MSYFKGIYLNEPGTLVLTVSFMPEWRYFRYMKTKDGTYWLRIGRLNLNWGIAR